MTWVENSIEIIFYFLVLGTPVHQISVEHHQPDNHLRVGLTRGERIVDDDKLVDQRVEKSRLVVVGVGRGKLVVGTQLQAHHQALHFGIDLPCKVACHRVKRDELVAARDDVAIVGGELHGEDGKLVPLQAVFERPSRCVHAVIAGHQRVLLDSLGVALPKKIPDVVAVFDLRKKATNKLSGEHTRVELEDSSPKAKTVGHKTDFLRNKRSKGSTIFSGHIL